MSTYETEEIRNMEYTTPVKIKYQFDDDKNVKIISWEPALSREEMKDMWQMDDQEIDATFEEVRKDWFDNHRAEEYLYDELFNDSEPSFWFDLAEITKYPTKI